MLLAHAWPLHMLHLVRTYTRLIGTELVYATQLDLSTESVADLLKRIVYTPGAYELGNHGMRSIHQWAEWGGRGWLGTCYMSHIRYLAKLESMIYSQLYLAQESSRQKQWEL